MSDLDPDSEVLFPFMSGEIPRVPDCSLYGRCCTAFKGRGDAIAKSATIEFAGAVRVPGREGVRTSNGPAPLNLVQVAVNR